MIMKCKDQEVQYQACWQVEDLKVLIITLIDLIQGIMQITTMPLMKRKEIVNSLKPVQIETMIELSEDKELE